MLFLFPFVVSPKFYESITMKKSLILASLTLAFVLIGFSRIYFGVHSIGQVILGWTYGGYMVVIFVTVAFDKIHKYSLIKQYLDKNSR